MALSYRKNNVTTSVPTAHGITDGTIDYTSRAKLKFENADITDDSTNDQTVVELHVPDGDLEIDSLDLDAIWNDAFNIETDPDEP